MAETKYEARLKTLYNKEIAKAKISVSLKP